MKFISIIRNYKSEMGKFGRIVSKELVPYIGKRVEVTIREISENGTEAIHRKASKK